MTDESDTAIQALHLTRRFGPLISTCRRPEQQAMITAFLAIMPMMLLSGFIFPICPPAASL